MQSLEEKNSTMKPDVAARLDNSEISALLKASKTNSFVPNEKKVDSNHAFYRKTLAEIASIADESDQVINYNAVENVDAEKQIETGENAINTQLESVDPSEASTDQVDNSFEFIDGNFDRPTTTSEKAEILVENAGNIADSNPIDLEKIAYLENKLLELEAELEQTKSSQSDLDEYLNLLKNVCIKLPPLANITYDEFENKIMIFLQEIISDRLGWEISEFPEKIADKITNNLSDLYQIGSRIVITMNASDAAMLDKEFSKFTNITIKIDDTYLTGDYSVSLGSLVLENKLRIPVKDVKDTKITGENP
jgi:hypothetical protein